MSVAIANTNNSGTYAGDGTTNRAIAHGLGRIPNLVFIASALSNRCIAIVKGHAVTHDIASAQEAVTAPDATNFYVGNAVSYASSANNNGDTYYWTAI